MLNRRFLARQGFAASLFLLGFATSVPAVFEDGLPPTIDEAHAFLAGTFQRYPVGYVTGNGRHAARPAAYGGEGCMSKLAGGRDRAVTLDWPAIASVEQLGPGEVEVEVVDGRRHANIRLSFPDERSARSSANALEVLRKSCAAPAEASLAARR